MASEGVANAVDDDNYCTVRKLSAEEIERLQKDSDLVSEFKRNKLEKEAEKNWDLFYKRNTTKFFKDRHWTKREFEELVGREKDAGRRRVLFEVGCGVGNFMFPLLEEDDTKSLFIYACDFSKRAVQFVKDHGSYDEQRCCAFHADITTRLSDNVPDNSVDLATMIFVLSAIHPDKMLQALTNVLQTLKPGGVLLFRDYGLYDYAMLRFAPGHKLAERFYVRQDGTRAYYFSQEFLQGLAERAGFKIGQIDYIRRETVNKKEGLCVPRIFVQAKFLKPRSTTHCSPELLHASSSDQTVDTASNIPEIRTCVGSNDFSSLTDGVQALNMKSGPLRSSSCAEPGKVTRESDNVQALNEDFTSERETVQPLNQESHVIESNSCSNYGDASSQAKGVQTLKGD